MGLLSLSGSSVCMLLRCAPSLVSCIVLGLLCGAVANHGACTASLCLGVLSLRPLVVRHFVSVVSARLTLSLVVPLAMVGDFFLGSNRFRIGVYDIYI